MATAAALVEFARVSVLFDGRVRALDDVTLAIGKGEIVGWSANPGRERARCAECSSVSRRHRRAR
jgi:hypothetical protein